MAGDCSRGASCKLEERLGRMELGFKKVKDYVFGWPLDAVENSNAREILELQEIVSNMKRHVPDIAGRNDGSLPSGNLRLEDQIKVMESNLDQMKDYLSSSPLEVIEAANAATIVDLRRVVLELKEHVVAMVTPASILSPYACRYPNGFNAPCVQELVESCGAQQHKMDKLRRGVQQAISETTGCVDLVRRLANLIHEEDDGFEDYKPSIPSPSDDYCYDCDRSPKGPW